ncbi:hypothetical protein ACOMHN_047807 [Nucella lapillus]
MRMLLWSAIAVALVTQSRGQNLASCANTDCGPSKVCRIIERCWGSDCQVGTMCANAADFPMSAVSKCQFEQPLLYSKNGGNISEIQCSLGSVTSQCPAGTTCVGAHGACCTGANKTVGACPSKPENYYLSHGECKVFCQHDQHCPGFERCCDTGTGCFTCMKPVPVNNCETEICGPGSHCVMNATECMQYPCFSKPTCVPNKAGECPLLPKQVSCADQCKVDSHCPDDKKCCNAGGCSVCVAPGAPTTQPPPPNFNAGGFDGLDASSNSGDGSGSFFGTSDLNTSDTSSSGSSSAFPSMSGFMDGSGGAGSSSGGLDTGTAGFGDGMGSLSSSLSSSSSSSMDLASNPFSNMLNTLNNGGLTNTGSSNPLSSMLNSLNNGGLTNTGSSNPMSSVMEAMKTTGGGGSMGSGSPSMTSMMGNVQDMMNQLSSGGPNPTNPFSTMMNNLKNLNPSLNNLNPNSFSNNLNGLNTLNPSLNSGGSLFPSPSSSSSSSSSSLGSMTNALGGGLNGFGSSGGRGLSPVLSGNTLKSIGSLGGPGMMSGLGGGLGGGLPSLGGMGVGGLGAGGGGGLMPSGLNPQLPMLGGRRNTGRRNQRNGNRRCGMMCMMTMMSMAS